MKFISLALVLIIFTFSCASKPPQQQENICTIFKEKTSWYRLANRSEEKWGAPIHVQMSIVRQESAFQNRAKPERTKLLGIVPWKRKTSAFGYSQAVDGTWDWYKKETKRPLASRVNFSDAIDFTGWYINKTNKINGIKKSDAYNQYLAYHEGHGGFKSKSYNNKDWLIKTATKVDQRAEKYRQQLDQCKSQFKKKIFGIF
jgi:hypothetical protein